MKSSRGWRSSARTSTRRASAKSTCALAHGVSPERLSFGNTIKKQRDIAAAFERGVRLFAFDSEAELQKLAESAPGARVFCRILVDCSGAEWPLSRKFGCEIPMAADLLVRAKGLGLDPYGISFHCGSQQTDLAQFDKAIAQAAGLFADIAKRGITLRMINVGGGFPSRYHSDVPPIISYGQAIRASLKRHFAQTPDLIVEPGRYVVGDAGVIQSEVVLVAHKGGDDERRWVYLDVGKFHGLAETMDEAIKYRLLTPHDGGETTPGGARGPNLRQRRHPLREDRLPPAEGTEGRRQSPDPLDRRLHDDVLVDRLQRHAPARQRLHLKHRAKWDADSW